MSIIVRNVTGLRAAVARWRSIGQRVALVPTMGALHEGHLALIKHGFENADKVVVSIFVNPKQFGVNEDLACYPRDEDQDVQLLAEAKVDLVYAPSVDDIYGVDFSTTVTMAGPAKTGLEDKFRPHFFDGVATIVAKLFIQSGADAAVFGEKDYQQLMVVKQLVRDLDIVIAILSVPTLRDFDGMAMSSRNRFLSKHERNQAAAIIRTLEQAAEKIKGGTEPQSATRAAARSLTTLGFKVDYVAARNSETLAVPTGAKEPMRLLAAAWLGKTRLIDNIPVL